jgi:HSP20 family protein
MEKQIVPRSSERVPSVFDDFFKPWNEWFDGGNIWNRMSHLPAVNITEEKDAYLVSLAAPGLKKEDFKIDIDGNLLTVSSRKEETKEEKETKFTRKEYNYSSFSRTFTLPEEISKDKIEAKYENGLLNITLPLKKEALKASAQQVPIK